MKRQDVTDYDVGSTYSVGEGGPRLYPAFEKAKAAHWLRIEDEEIVCLVRDESPAEEVDQLEQSVERTSPTDLLAGATFTVLEEIPSSRMRHVHVFRAKDRSIHDVHELEQRDARPWFKVQVHIPGGDPLTRYAFSRLPPQ